ncbi:OLC1v1028432C1 [Oldenlandia corymbosa var. corymbosa]|uniref:OLC1v1028432C1 n=1 Tax=Oldenlandia corymbosa var. corymbosa TaxID=529605 RepID=A0AAV1CBY6_OLDCO|nr:OLC1v1028432C1 [Oldenlandia corymbosa var. corymbosa]
MGLSSLLQPKSHGGYVETQQYYSEHRDEYYPNPGHGKRHYDHYPENGFHGNNSGSSMQMVRPYPNIVTPQAPHHHQQPVGHDGYYEKPHYNYGKPSNYDAGYYGDHNGQYSPNRHGHGYDYDRHMYGGHGHGHGNMYPNGPARVESSSMGFSYERMGHNNRGPEVAKWIARGIDD